MAKEPVAKEPVAKRPAARGSRGPVDASMTLINEVMHRPLDPGYAAAAQAKKRALADGKTFATSSQWKVISLLLAVVLGFVTAASVASLRSRADVAAGARSVLITEITERTQKMDGLDVAITDLTDRTNALSQRALSQSGSQDSATTRDQIRNGAIAVTGPGLSVTVSDGARASEDPEFAVQDSDLRVIVSALWSAGAEAISVNDKRLTPTSAIRSAGSAILVDLTGLSAPYTINAIGDAEVLAKGLRQGDTAVSLETLRSQYGISIDSHSVKQLTLDAGSSRALLHARVPEDGQ